jgi:hypothetical protein
MIGYHYTPTKTWAQIQEDGFLKPKPLKLPKHDKLKSWGFTDAIFVFPKRPAGIANAGQLLWHFCDKSDFDISLLEVQYEQDEIQQGDPAKWPYANLPGDILNITHDGWLGTEQGLGMNYHYKELMHLLKNPIPLSRVKLLHTYNFLNMIDEIERRDDVSLREVPQPREVPVGPVSFFRKMRNVRRNIRVRRLPQLRS